MISYPRARVVVGFALCPSMLGLIHGFIQGWVEYRSVDTLITDALAEAGAITMVYGVYGLLLGVLFSYVQLYKTIISLLFVSFFSGITATLWSLILFGTGEESGYGTDSGKPISAWFFPIHVFIVGSLFSFFVSLIILPKET
ncbi:uncharacterized protein YacL [Pseudomonas sp. 3296]|uniref:hypothetical protein n=1 Tax=Pseudomonas sp. 3296 TaxID=2817753 RepID=UPI0028657218|nr:hypothetical protein [Pseudomonas sp. 3296]MDR6913436.1 uncharacterized protein YacL [Pseudomonas sp. 3296]